ncbi:MAG: DUF2330 domain-containing protein [Chloroflexi bacterium]|nr:MAG: DUF2330 domain-containing protein [Chloroflexota bacterium]
MLRRLLAGGALAVAIAAAQAIPAAACGGLVAPNGAVRLARATTFVAWHDGVERYMTSFTYQGVVWGSLGWIVPLPAVPTKVESGGGWTLQRLFRETHPIQFDALSVAGAGKAGAAPAQAVVLQQTTVEALDITVLKGSGQAVIDWCRTNGFTLPDETRAHILMYAQASPIFMAARYDVESARRLGRFEGDGTPVLITMPTPHLWVPLEVLANAQDPVNADLYLLTDQRLTTGEEWSIFGIGSSSVGDTLPGAPGFVVRDQRPMNAALYRDLSRDRHMGWVPSTGWLTYLALDAPSPKVDYDLGVTGSGTIQLASFAGRPGAVAEPGAASGPYAPQARPSAGLIALAVLMVTTVAAAVGLATRRVLGRRRPMP